MMRIRFVGTVQMDEEEKEHAVKLDQKVVLQMLLVDVMHFQRLEIPKLHRPTEKLNKMSYVALFDPVRVRV